MRAASHLPNYQVTTTIESPHVNLAVLKRMAEIFGKSKLLLRNLIQKFLKPKRKKTRLRKRLSRMTCTAKKWNCLSSIWNQRFALSSDTSQTWVCSLPSLVREKQSLMNRDVPVSLDEDRPQTRSAISYSPNISTSTGC